MRNETIVALKDEVNYLEVVKERCATCKHSSQTIGEDLQDVLHCNFHSIGAFEVSENGICRLFTGDKKKIWL